VWEINVGSIFRMARFAVPAMPGGVIVNLASVHAYASMRDNAVYAATKGAIVSLTTQMALDLAEHEIRVVALAPGSIDTPMTRYEFSRRGLTAQEAGFGTGPGNIGRVASADEVAEVIAWLASPAASLINATTITTDAGLMARLV
jgi:NAD(P)-dependent dehydrogenase (short-subunit alcohol dehydrogenase family)